MTQTFDSDAQSQAGGQRQRFAYEVQSRDGHAMSGTVEAGSASDARAALENSGLRVIQIEASDAGAGRPRPLRGVEFAAFNQQLAQLTASGMPVERGLRLIARDMNSPRLAATINRVAEELEAGQSLAEAFEKHRGQFPPLYGRLVDAGVRSSQLPAVLFNLGQHIEMIQQLRATLWRAAAYPVMVLVGLMAVMVFLGVVIVPGFRDVYGDFQMELPFMTEAVFIAAEWMPAIGLATVAAVVGASVGWWLLSASGKAQAASDYLLTPLPLLGPVLRANLAARWCDAARLGVQAGLDLPAAFELAGDAVASPLAQRDGRALRATLEAGRSLDQHPPLAVIPATVPAAVHLASQRHDLAGVLENLAQMYQQQAELRLSTLQIALTPLMLLALAIILGLVISAMFMPLVQLMQWVM
ncbi:MAG: type II secretion system F family protein [Phycisphaeraceae bacterium]